MTPYKFNFKELDTKELDRLYAENYFSDDLEKAKVGLYYKVVKQETELVYAQAELLLEQLSLLSKTGRINLSLSSLMKIKEDIEKGFDKEGIKYGK